MFPGVGSFPKAIENLNKLKLKDFLKDQLQRKKKPYLGICLGMQILLTKSFELGETFGLDVVNGEVKKLKNHPF